MSFDPTVARSQFPALRRRVDGRAALYLDGPGGTQVPSPVIDAMVGFMEAGGSNHGGPFVTSRETDAVAAAARLAMADLFNARPDEIAFGQNMTSLTLSVSRALARTWEAGDEIVLTRLDHDANVSPWMIAAAERGVTVRMADFDAAAGCVLDPAAVAGLLGPRTRLVAVTHASNALGSIVDVAAITAAAHAVGALVYVDAVHYTPHGSVDVRAIGCDFLAASSYKFFGPHTGIFYGRHDLLEELEAVKIRPAPSDAPGKWETGTQSFESLAGVTAAVDYLAAFGSGATRRDAVSAAMGATQAYEAQLSAQFLDGIAGVEGVTLYGLPTSNGRTPTFAVSVAGMSAAAVAERLGAMGIFVWSGHYYALEVMASLGVLDSGGLVRIGFVHYNLPEEVDIVVEALARLAAGRSLDDLPDLG